ncbi:MAG: LysE family translocator [Rhodospirillaceae bacterium]|nr:LysE family translocator [Rhodospirillaceae bacterium]MBT6119279.1 LysE family translocator [Rhodospirillaceae bacterium]
MTRWLAFLVFSFVAAITPGPSNVILTAAGARAGIWRGLPCLMGVSLGMGLMMFLVAYGLGQFVLDNPDILRVLQWCGAAFLLWLAWRIATASSGGPAVEEGPPVGFLGAAGFQWINPKSWTVTAGAVGAYLQGDAGGAFAQALGFGLLFVVAAVPSGFLWLAFGAGMKRILASERSQRVFSIAMGVLLAASVVTILA